MAQSGNSGGDPIVRAAQVVSGQWRAMPDGIAGIHGNYGDLVSVSYRL
jgi:hypothetical protein